jgi:hypothetical protein
MVRYFEYSIVAPGRKGRDAVGKLLYYIAMYWLLNLPEA